MGRTRRDGVRVLIVADHDPFRDILRAMLEGEGIEVVAETRGGEEALELAPRVQPDVILLDVGPPEAPGRELIRRLANVDSAPRVVALTASADPDELLDLLAAGACGYLPKDDSVQTIAGRIVRAAAAGLPLLSERTVLAMIGRLRELGADQRARADAVRAKLSHRELEVLGLIADGVDNAAIATALFISPETVKHHVHSILGKLGVENRVQAAVVAVRAGLV